MTDNNYHTQNFGRNQTINQAGHQRNHLAEGRIHNSSTEVNHLNQDLPRDQQNKFNSTSKLANFGGQTAIATERVAELQRAKTSFTNLSRVDSSTQNLDIAQSRGHYNENQAPNSGPPKFREGLTEFLRSEYYRRLGVYINRARDEKAKLIQFFYEYVSIENKKLRQANLEAKASKESEFTFQRPAIKPAKTNSEPKSKLDLEYERYGSFSAFDIGHTVEHDLLNEFQAQSQMKQQQSAKKEDQLQSQSAAADKQKVRLMLQWCFVWGPKVKEGMDRAGAAKQKNKELKATIRKMKAQGQDVTELSKKLSTSEKLKYEEQHQLITKDVLKSLPMFKNKVPVVPSTKVHSFFTRLIETYIDLCYQKKIQWKENLSEKTLLDIYKDLNQNRGRDQALPSESEARQYIAKFLSRDEFLTRLSYHKEHIKSATAKVNAKLTERLYFVSLNYHEKWVSMLNQDGDSFLKQLEDQEKHLRELELEKKKKGEMSVIKEKKNFDAKRMEELSKPKDKWKKGRVLKELYREFPHDRVLERMIKEEFGTNQLFKYPEEYDVYNNEQDEKLKKFPVTDTGKKRDMVAERVEKDAKGMSAIDSFKDKDKSDLNGVNHVIKKQKQQQLQFERNLIEEVQGYLQETKTRIMCDSKIGVSGKRKTLRTSLGQIYSKLREKFFVFVVKNYPMMSDKIHPGKIIPAHQSSSQVETELRQQENIEKSHNDKRRSSKKVRKSSGNKSGYEDESEVEEPEIREYPERFKRQFFRTVKALMDNKPNLTQAQKRKRIRQLPTAFMISSSKSRCTMHTLMCPTDDCPYITLNQKVIMTRAISKKIAEKPDTLRQRVFYREDKKDKIAQVFMSQSDQINCTFEPKAAALMYKIDPSKRQPDFYKMMGGESGPNTYAEKHVDNFKKSHPEIFKAGKLKKAQLEYKQGDYKKSMTVLSEGFNIYSMRRRFEPGFIQKEKAEIERKAAKNNAIKSASTAVKNMLKHSTEQMNKEAEEQKKHPTSPLEKKITLADMKETVADTQKNMHPEDFENIKLTPILKEAFELWAKLNKFQQDNIKKAKVIEKQRTSLSATRNRLKNAHNDETEPKTEFKTIMCPLGDDCTHHAQKKGRSAQKVTLNDEGKHNFKCPYAHHLMELEFPETLLSKINSLKHTAKNIKDVETQKHGIHKKVFYPANKGEIRKGLFDRITDPNVLQRRKESLYKKMKNNDTELYEYLSAIHDLDHKMMQVKGDAGSSSRSVSSQKSGSNETGPRDKDGNLIFRTDSVGRRYRVEKDAKGHPIPHHELTVDFNYCKKFGQLKQASILFNEGCLNEAWNVILESVRLIKAQKLIEMEKQQKIEERWKTRLDLNAIAFDDPAMKLAFQISPLDTLFWTNFYAKNQQLIENPDKKAAVKMYISQVSPWFNDSQYNKNEFLNGCIEELFYKIENEQKRKSNFYTLLKSVQSQERNNDDEVEADDDRGDADGRKSTFKKFRKSQKEGEEREEVIVWQYDLVYPYKKPRARTPNLCKTWYPERDKTYDDEGPEKVAESKKKRMDLLHAQQVKRKEDAKSKKDHLKTCNSAHYLYQLGNIRPSHGDGQGGADDDNKAVVTLKAWEVFERDPLHEAWTPASNAPYKDPSLFAPYNPSKTKGKGGEGQNNEEDQGTDDLFNPNRQTEIVKPKPKEMALEKK